MANATLVDIIGKVYGRLTVLERTRVGKRVLWKCRCECGKITAVRSDALKRIESCGCLVRESVKTRFVTHGHVRDGKPSRTYAAWQNMLRRCGPSGADFKNYAARGITVCNRWATSFDAFLADMGEAPTKMTLERIENNRGYEPDNCRWATRKDQSLNTRRNRILEIDGVSKPLTQWSEESGVKPQTIHSRIDRGIPPKEAVFSGHYKSGPKGPTGPRKRRLDASS